MNSADELVTALLARAGKQSGDEISFCCFDHDDHTASASYNVTKGLWVCHGCGAKGNKRDLCSKLRIEIPDQGANRSIEKTYDYTDENGELVFQKVRYAGKRFAQRQPDGVDGWKYSLEGVRRVLYRLPEVREAIEASRTVYLCEGEKDANAVVKLGLCATTNTEGAGKWREEYTSTLAEATVVILPDNDEPGRDHAEQVVAKLEPVAADVRIVKLSVDQEHGDAYDWIADRRREGKTTDEIRSTLEDLVADAEPYRPSLPTSFRLLSDVIADPSALEPAEAVIPHLAWRGRVTLLAAPEKDGKSTLLSALAARLTAGQPPWSGN